MGWKFCKFIHYAEFKQSRLKQVMQSQISCKFEVTVHEQQEQTSSNPECCINRGLKNLNNFILNDWKYAPKQILITWIKSNRYSKNSINCEH